MNLTLIKEKFMMMQNVILKNKRNILIVLILLILIFMAILFFRPEKEKSIKKDYEISLGNEIFIDKISKYSGLFVEDGSDREVEDVWMLTVSNHSNQDIQFLRIKASDGKNSGIFDVTTLQAGATVEVMESTALKLPEWADDCQYSVENLAYFSTELSLHKDLFTVSAKDNWIQVENNSDTAITNDIYVYYKNVDEDIFHGGITYRVKFSGGIAARQSKQIQAKHYLSKQCKILYLTYQ